MVFFALAFSSLNSTNAQKQKPQNSQSKQSVEPEYVDDDEFDGSVQDVDRAIEPLQSTGPNNLVYVGDNVSTGAGIKIFRRDNMGVLTEMPNSPVPTGGKGMFDVTGFNRMPTGIFAATDIGPFEHDGNMIITPDRSRIFIVNQGSDDLSVFDVSADGLTLTPVPGSPFKTGRVPSSVALAAFDTVVVVNKNDPAGNPKPMGNQGSLITYKMAANGSLTPVPNSEIKLPSARGGEGVIANQSSTPSQVIPSQDGKVVFVNDFFGGMIRPYKVLPDGHLQATKPFDIRSLGFDVLPANGKTFPFSLGIGIHPLKNILYTGLLFENKVAVFTFSPKSGKMKFQGTATNGGSTVCWFTFRKDGEYVWTTNQASNSVSVYDLDDPLKPVEIQVVQFQGCGEPAQVTTSPDQNWIYYVNSAVTNKCSQKDPDTRSNMVHTLKITTSGADEGKFNELTQPRVMTELPLGERIEGVVTK